MMGATVVDTTYAAWGCGIGMELASSGGTTPTKSVYTGPAKCFNITLTGNSGGNPVRIGFSQSADAASRRGVAVQGDPGVHERLDGPGLLRGRHLPQLGGPDAAGKCTKAGTRRHARRHAAADPGRRPRRHLQRLHHQDRARAIGQHRHRRLGRRHVQLRDAERIGHDHARSSATRTSCARRTTSSRTTPGARPRRPDDHVRPGHEVQGDGAEREPAPATDARRLPVDLHRRVQQPQHRPAAACRARSARSPRAACRPASPGRTTARPAARTPPTTSGSAPARAAIPPNIGRPAAAS